MIPTDSIPQINEQALSLWQEPTLSPPMYGGSGWAFLLATFSLLTIILIFWWIRRYRKNLYRREALYAISQLDYSLEALNKLHRILKSTAIYALGPEVKQMTGREYTRILIKAYPSWKITPMEYETLEQSRLRNQIPEKEAFNLHVIQIKNWILHHGV